VGRRGAVRGRLGHPRDAAARCDARSAQGRPAGARQESGANAENRPDASKRSAVRERKANPAEPPGRKCTAVARPAAGFQSAGRPQQRRRRST